MHYAQATAERKHLLTAVFTTVYCRLGNILSYLRELLLKYACKHCCSSLLFGKGGSNVDASLDGPVVIPQSLASCIVSGVRGGYKAFLSCCSFTRCGVE